MHPRLCIAAWLLVVEWYRFSPLLFSMVCLTFLIVISQVICWRRQHWAIRNMAKFETLPSSNEERVLSSTVLVAPPGFFAGSGSALLNSRWKKSWLKISSRLFILSQNVHFFPISKRHPHSPKLLYFWQFFLINQKKLLFTNDIKAVFEFL